MKRFLLLGLFYAWNPTFALAGTGTEAASFLDIPVGAEPAALGSAYSARAENAYATIWNPAGLARVETPELSAMYLAYLVDTSYQQASVAIPWKKGEESSGFGVSIQSLGSGKIEGRDENGNATSDFTSRFSAYSLGYGQSWAEDLSVGAAVKVIQEKISDASATAYALDGGVLYNWTSQFTLALAVSNAGSRLKLANQADPLPLQIRTGAAWRINPTVHLMGETVYRRNGTITGHFGTEWSPSSAYAIRLGYQTHHTKELGAMAGFTTGFGMRWKGQEFSYAFVPFGELGNTHTLSLTLRWSTQPRHDRAFPDYAREQEKAERDDPDFKEAPTSNYSDYRNLYDILSDNERKSLKSPEKADKESE